MLNKPTLKRAANPFFFILVFAFFSTGCGTPNIGKVPKNHILMFNAKGNPVDPCTFAVTPAPNQVDPSEPYNCQEVRKAVWPKDYKTQDKDEFDKHLDSIFKGIEKQFKNKTKKKVLFYVHGGLNSRSGALERVVDTHWKEDTDKNADKQLYKKIIAGGYYPIFINWHSGLVSTYGDHLLNIRQGEDSPVLGAITAPVVFGIDVARSIARAPLVITSFLTNDLKTNPSIEEEFFDTTATEIADNISKKPNPDPKICENTKTPEEKREGKINVYRGEDCRSLGEKTRYSLTYLATLPITRIPFVPFIDGFGTSSWSNMLRRVQLLYNSDREYHSYLKDYHQPKEGSLYKRDAKDYLNIPLSGGLSRFMEKFIEKFQHEMVQKDQKDQNDQKGEDKKGMEITLVGHSTGANVLNELIRNFGATEQKGKEKPLDLPIKNIVYMAAACTVSHFQSTVIPYLLQNTDTEFHNLTLGRDAEMRDEYGGITPRGSLLVWIDEFLTNPLTHRERTLGRFDNFMLTAHEIPYSVRNRIHLKTYSTGTTGSVGKENPQHHSDFGEKIKFWKKECWKDTSTDCYRK